MIHLNILTQHDDLRNGNGTYTLGLDGSAEEVDFVVDDGGAVRVLFESVARQFLDLPARFLIERLAEIAIVFRHFRRSTCIRSINCQ